MCMCMLMEAVGRLAAAVITPFSRARSFFKNNPPSLPTAVCGVTVDTAPRAATLPPPTNGGSGGGEAAGCVSLACSGCGAPLGRRYGGDVPPRLARVAGLFCLEVDALASHELGSADLLARPKAGGGAAAGATTTTAPLPADDTATLAARLAALEDELVRVQGVVLAQNERLERLEGGGA